jgi:hypothetical protein
VDAGHRHSPRRSLSGSALRGAVTSAAAPSS